VGGRTEVASGVEVNTEEQALVTDIFILEAERGNTSKKRCRQA
jgi:hypothetical protein